MDPISTAMTTGVTESNLNVSNTCETFNLTQSSNSTCENNTFSGNISIPEWSQIQFLVNVTKEVPYQYAVVLFGYIMPFLLIITIIANTLIVIVLSQRHMRTPTNLVLLSMAIADLLTLLFPAPWYFYMYTLDNHRKILYPPSACYSYHCMIEVIPVFFHTASIWLTLLLAGQRYIYVCHLSTARTWCTIPRVTKAMLIIFVAAFLHQSTRFGDREFRSVAFKWNGTTRSGCEFLTAQWVHKTIGEDLYYIIYYGFRILFVYLGPCTTLILLNVLLFKELKKAQKKREKLFAENRKSESVKLRDANSTTIMLIVIVTVFLMVEIPMSIVTILHIMQNALNISIVDYDILNTAILFINFFIMLSYPVNFAIYCGMSRQFRQTFKDLFLFGNITTNTIVQREGSSKYSAINGPKTSTIETIV